MKTKKISKILIPTSILPLCSMSMIACGNKNSYDKLANILKEDVINEFTGMTGRPDYGNNDPESWVFHRSTFNTKPFIEQYLIPRIIAVSKESGLNFKEADFHHTKNEYDPGEELRTDQTGYNFYFDVPAYPSTCDLVPIVIQCHTDMVWAGEDDEALGASYVNWYHNFVENRMYTVPVRDDKQQIAHGRTSLGADNGIGIATAITICKHWQDFTHGPIRFLMTTDEEDGPSGASFVSQEDFVMTNNETINYLLNVDLEDTQIMGKSCCGTQQAKWTQTYDGDSTEESGHKLVKIKPADENVWSLDLTGLLGGHSGLEINLNRINAVKFAFDILGSINYNGHLRLIQFSSNAGSSSKISNSIPNQFHVMFSTDISDTTVENLVKCNIEIAKRMHPSENKPPHMIQYELVKCDPSKVQGYTGMTYYDTDEAIRFISELWYGPLSWLESGAVESCANVATTLFRNNVDETPLTSDTGTLEINVIGRSSNINELGNEPTDDPTTWEGFMKAYDLMSAKIFGTLDPNPWLSTSWTPPWAPRENDNLQKILMEASSELNQTLEPSDEPGWLEVAYFVQANPRLNIACIGPTITGSHTPQETLYTDSIAPMLKLILYTLEHLPQKSTQKGEI